MTRETIGKLKIILSMTIFGTLGLLVKYIALPSSVVALVRALVGVLFLLVVCFVRRWKMDYASVKQNAVLLTLSGSALGFNWILLFEAYRFTSVAVGTVCYYMAPILVMLFSPLVLKEKLTVKKFICIFAALIGMVFISGVQNGSLPAISEMKGVIFGLSAAVLYASIVMMNKKIKGVSTFDRTIVQLGISAVLLIVYCGSTVDVSVLTFDTRTVVLLLVAGVIHTGLAYFLYFGAVEAISAQSAAMISYLDPALAVFTSVFLLGEELAVWEIIGAGLILGAAVISEWSKRKKAVKNPDC